MATKKNVGVRGSKSEQSLLQKLHEMLPTQTKVYYIVWKHAKHLLPKQIDTFEDLTREYKGFTEGMDEAQCERWLTEESVQAAEKYLIRRLHKQRLIELYEIYFENAKKDVNAFKAFMDFSEKFFADEGDNEILTILNGIKLGNTE